MRTISARWRRESVRTDGSSWPDEEARTVRQQPPLESRSLVIKSWFGLFHLGFGLGFVCVILFL